MATTKKNAEKTKTVSKSTVKSEKIRYIIKKRC